MADILGFRKLQQQLKKLIVEQKKQRNPSVIVGYTANYALYVHENKEMKLKGKPRPKRRGNYWDPQGQAKAKFLEDPARELQPVMATTVRDVTRKTGSLRKGLLAAGLMLQRASQKQVPVDTGNLKNSAFTLEE